MSLNFVTGKRGGAHISSADWRSLNRGIVGEGKFYLEDTTSNSSGDFLANASEGQITVPPRSFIWSGAHIRNDSLYVVDYVPPTSTSNVVLWFHYTKDINTGIESIEFVTTVDSQPSPIADVIEDNTLEAYTAVYSFTHDAENLVAKDGTEFFKNANSLKILEESTRLIANNLQAEINTREMQLSNVNRNIGGLQTEIQEIQDKFPQAQLKTKKLVSGASIKSGSIYEAANESLSKYTFFVVLRKAEDGKTYPMFIPAISGGYSFLEVYSEDVNLTNANKTIVGYSFVSVTTINNNSFRITYDSNTNESHRDAITDVIGYYY